MVALSSSAINRAPHLGRGALTCGGRPSAGLAKADSHVRAAAAHRATDAGKSDDHHRPSGGFRNRRLHGVEQQVLLARVRSDPKLKVAINRPHVGEEVVALIGQRLAAHARNRL